MEGAVVEAVLPAAAALQRHEVAVLLLHLREGSMIEAVAVLLLRLRDSNSSMIKAVAVLLLLQIQDDSMIMTGAAHAAVPHTAFPRLEVVLRRGICSMEVGRAVISIEVGRAVISMKVEGVVNEVERAAAAIIIITAVNAASVHGRQKQAVKAHEA